MLRMRHAILSLAALASTGSVLAAEKVVIDNDRVKVWDVQLKAGESGPELPRDLDAFGMFLEGGNVRIAEDGGKATVHREKFGDALSFPKGHGFQQVAASSNIHEIVVAIKDAPSPNYQNASSLPAAFPRPGSVKVLDTPRVVVWRYSWVPGKPTPMHFHDKDVVVAYRFDGGLKSVTPDGKEIVNHYKAGDIRYNKGDRAHYELLTDAHQSAVMAELK